eukprot:gene13151-13254_t
MTPIGEVSEWPVSLRISVSNMLSTPFPTYIAWGTDYTQIYNDGYRPILGSLKHPAALGISTRETFSEIWDIVGPMFAGVMEGNAVGFPNFMLPLNRNGFIEECFFDFSYSPIKDESGVVGGVLVTVIEITEKVKALNALNDLKSQLEKSAAQLSFERNMLNDLFGQVPAGICILDGADLIYEFINPFYQQFFPGRELLGKPLFEALPEIINQPIAEIIQKVYTTGETFEEVTETVKSKEQSKNRERLMEELIMNAKYGLLILRGDEWICEIANQPIAEMWNKDLDQIIGNPLMEVLPEIKDQPFPELLRRVFTTGEPHREEEEESLKHLLKNIADSESKFRNIIKQAPVAIGIYTGLELNIDVYNDKLLEFWGRTAEQVKNKPLFEAIPEARGQGYEQLLLNVFKTGERFIANELPVTLMRDGVLEEVWINFIYDPVKDLNGSITGVIAVSNEVTDQVNSRKQLQQALEQIRLSKEAAQLGTFDMNLEKGTMHWDDRCRTLFGISHNGEVTYEHDFINGLHPDDRDRVLKIIENVFIKDVNGGDYDVEYRTVGFEDQKVSHELKTPLTTLTAVVQVAKSKLKEAEDPFLKTAMQTADSQVRKMGNLITGFLNISKLDAGKISITKQKFLIDRLIQEIIEESRLTSTSHSIDLSPCDPLHVWADRDKIDDVQISVEDEGMGIKPKDIEHLFDRYYRVESKYTANIAGFGIGLLTHETIYFAIDIAYRFYQSLFHRT